MKNNFLFYETLVLYFYQYNFCCNFILPSLTTNYLSMNCVNAEFAAYKTEVSHFRQNPYWLFETILYNTLRKYFNDVSQQETASLATIMYQLSPSNQS